MKIYKLLILSLMTLSNPVFSSQEDQCDIDILKITSNLDFSKLKVILSENSKSVANKLVDKRLKFTKVGEYLHFDRKVYVVEELIAGGVSSIIYQVKSLDGKKLIIKEYFNEAKFLTDMDYFEKLKSIGINTVEIKDLDVSRKSFSYNYFPSVNLEQFISHNEELGIPDGLRSNLLKRFESDLDKISKNDESWAKEIDLKIENFIYNVHVDSLILIDPT